jgi:histidinol dehydrogenase
MRILEFTGDEAAVRALIRRRQSLDPTVVARAQEILNAVERDGDAAVLQYTRTYDCPAIETLGMRVSEAEVRAAYNAVPADLLRALKKARANVARYHKRQLPKSWVMNDGGLRLEQRFMPLARVGIYVPGGKAAYPSTVVMNAVPATIAGVKEIVMVSPAGKDGTVPAAVLVAAAECGVMEIYRIGGAQAIAALAFGTATIRPVDKITGPGNAYVAAAKKLVYGTVGIDMIAGPTEVVVIADETANPAFVAADLIAQAEHDQDATSLCLVTSAALAGRIRDLVREQLETAPRALIARTSLEQNGRIIVVPSLAVAVELANSIAPEHLEIMTRNARRLSQGIRNAGAIFVGRWATEALGDYVAGPNHTLPTSGTARFSSALNVMDFITFSNVIECSREHFMKLAPYGEMLARAEGLAGHEASMAIRRRTR